MAGSDDGFPCWAWWQAGDKPGYHRCVLSGDHPEHECCCGTKTADAMKPFSIINGIRNREMRVELEDDD